MTGCRPLGRGHIHDTFVAVYRSDGATDARYVHQRLNTRVFADLAVLAANLERVTDHLAERAAVRGRPALQLLRATSGGSVARDHAGAPWRTFAFLEGTESVARFDRAGQARAAATAAAELVADLADLPGPPLAEVIPGFHDIPRRLRALEEAAAEDRVGRARACRPEVEAVLASAGLADEVADARATGRLPERTVHNDAKADNVLLDPRTGKAVCLVDLDTVGPGTVLFDVGDLVRSGAAAAAEDGGPGRVGVRVEVADAVLEAYGRAGAGFLTAAELELLPRAGALMALEAAARFLTDHLQGDVYFRVETPEHNLTRTRNQIRLVEQLSGADGAVRAGGAGRPRGDP